MFVVYHLLTLFFIGLNDRPNNINCSLLYSLKKINDGTYNERFLMDVTKRALTDWLNDFLLVILETKCLFFSLGHC